MPRPASANHARLTLILIGPMLVLGLFAVVTTLDVYAIGAPEGLAQRDPSATPTATEGPFYPPLGAWRPVHSFVAKYFLARSFEITTDPGCERAASGLPRTKGNVKISKNQ